MARQLQEVQAKILLMVMVVAAAAVAISVSHRLLHRIKNPRSSRIIHSDSRFKLDENHIPKSRISSETIPFVSF